MGRNRQSPERRGRAPIALEYVPDGQSVQAAELSAPADTNLRSCCRACSGDAPGQCIVSVKICPLRRHLRALSTGDVGVGSSRARGAKGGACKREGGCSHGIAHEGREARGRLTGDDPFSPASVYFYVQESHQTTAPVGYKDHGSQQRRLFLTYVLKNMDLMERW